MENKLEEVKEQPPDPVVEETTDAHPRRRQSLPALARFMGATRKQWDDWHWQLAHRFSTPETASLVLRLTEDERAAMAPGHGLPFAVTPHYMSLVDPDDPAQPLRRTVIPTLAERAEGPGEAADPLGEDGHSPVPGLVHRYPDRVLFLVTGFCSTYCRYCTRSRAVGKSGCAAMGRKRWQMGINYIASHPEVRDVLLSGGDPLTLPDQALDWLLTQLRRIPHVEVVRIGSKVPAVLPQRVTRELVRMLKRHHPLWMSLHFTHPDELTPETVRACERLADAGIPLGSQTVLLKGVNDRVETLKSLYHGLMRARVRPYYLYQCDPIMGSAHFRTDVQCGLDMIRGLRGHTSGYAVPSFVIDAPGGGGKIPLLPDYAQGHDEQGLKLVNYENRVFHYPDAGAAIPVLA